MCKVYNFPGKKQLSKELEGEFQKLAEDYVKLINKALAYFEDENSTEEDVAENMEIVLNVYLSTVSQAINNS